MDCSYSWRVKLTEYGYCITNKDITNMTKTDEHEHIHGTSRNNVLDFTLAYNVTDWTSGYFGDIGGFIAYFSAPGQGEELRLVHISSNIYPVFSDVKTRVVLSGDQSTRVTIKTMHQNYLEAPYGLYKVFSL